MKTDRTADVEALPATEHEPTEDVASRHREGDEGIDPAVERVLQRVDLQRQVEQPIGSALESGPRLRMAKLARIADGKVYLRVRGRHDEVEADVDEEVDLELLRRSAEQGQAVLVEEEPGLLPVVVGCVQTRIPDTLELRARKILIEGEEEVLMRSGTGAMRVRQDGDVELVGSRISTMSRGLFRIVGRMLRLN